MKALKRIVTIAVAVIALSAFGMAAHAEDETLLEAFGASTGLALYNMQVIIGMAMDAHAGAVYTTDETRTIISEQKGALGVLKDYNDKLINVPTISKDDKDTLDKIYDCMGKLETLVGTFNKYLDSDTSENANKFESDRQSSYACISALLGLDSSDSQ